MAVKSLLALCASTLFLQAIFGQCIGNGFKSGHLNNGYGNGLVGSSSGLGLGSGFGNSGLGCSNGLGNIGNLASAGLNSAASGGIFGVSSGSPIYPSGLAVQSENSIGGNLDVAGTLPFVSTVALEGEVPSAGSAGVQYSCGNGNVDTESVRTAGFSYGSGMGSCLGFGTGNGLVGSCSSLSRDSGRSSGHSCSNSLGNIANFESDGLNSAASGGALDVSSASPIYPSGVAVQSENTIDGRLDVSGTLPFVSTAALEGEVPSAGSAGVQYSCGNGNIGIESVRPVGYSYSSGVGSSLGFGNRFRNAVGGIYNCCSCSS